jgi:hypothetical protein
LHFAVTTPHLILWQGTIMSKVYILQQWTRNRWMSIGESTDLDKATSYYRLHASSETESYRLVSHDDETGRGETLEMHDKRS